MDLEKEINYQMKHFIRALKWQKVGKILLFSGIGVTVGGFFNIIIFIIFYSEFLIFCSELILGLGGFAMEIGLPLTIAFTIVKNNKSKNIIELKKQLKSEQSNLA